MMGQKSYALLNVAYISGSMFLNSGIYNQKQIIDSQFLSNALLKRYFYFSYFRFQRNSYFVGHIPFLGI